MERKSKYYYFDLIDRCLTSKQIHKIMRKKATRLDFLQYI